MKTIKYLIPLLLLTGLALAGCAGEEQVQVEQPSVTVLPVIAEGHILPADSLYLSFLAAGRVDEILVEEGQQVRKGQVLIRLADRQQAEAALAAARLALEQAGQDHEAFLRTAGLVGANAWQAYLDAQTARAAVERQWEALDLEVIEEQVAEAEARVSDREQELEDAQEIFDRYADLDPDNASRKQAEDDLQKAQEAYNEAVRQQEAASRRRDSLRAALDLALEVEAEARHDFEASRDGPDAEQLALLEARLASAEAQAAAAENALANYDLTAPFTGTVTDINVSLDQLVGPETWVVLIADFSSWVVETSDLTELEVVRVAEGQTVSVVADALPGIVMEGVVERVGQSFRFQGGDVIYAVRIRLTHPAPEIRWGMTVEVEFPPEE